MWVINYLENDYNIVKNLIFYKSNNYLNFQILNQHIKILVFFIFYTNYLLRNNLKNEFLYFKNKSILLMN